MLIRDHRIERLPEQAPIWRYMGLDKFVHMLSTSSLHFTRLDRFSDPWEGSVSHVDWADFRDLDESWGPPNGSEWEPGFEPDQAATGLYWQVYNSTRAGYFVNCWHHNPHEQMALWQIYSDRGVAIRSTFGRLEACLDNPEDERRIMAGKVAYRDYRTHRIDTHYWPNLVYTKGMAFAYENEVRAAFFVEPWVRVEGTEDGYFTDRIEPSQPTGFDLVVDLPRLIDAIYVAPDRQPWFLDTVRSLIERYGPAEIPVEPSTLLQSPPWAKPPAWQAIPPAERKAYFAALREEKDRGGE